MAAPRQNNAMALSWIIKHSTCLWKSLESPIFFFFLSFCPPTCFRQPHPKHWCFCVVVEQETVSVKKTDPHHYSYFHVHSWFPHTSFLCFLIEVSTVPWHFCHSHSRLAKPELRVMCLRGFFPPWWTWNLWQDLFRWGWIRRLLLNTHLPSLV